MKSLFEIQQWNQVLRQVMIKAQTHIINWRHPLCVLRFFPTKAQFAGNAPITINSYILGPAESKKQVVFPDDFTRKQKLRENYFESHMKGADNIT